MFFFALYWLTVVTGVGLLTASAIATESSIPSLYRAVPIKIIDGDTFVARIEIWSDIFITPHIRLRGIDAPELPPKALCVKESNEAEKAKERLRVLLGKEVILSNIVRRKDRYGRVLTDVIIAKPLQDNRDSLVGRSVSHQLLKEGVVRPYTGDDKGESYWCSPMR